MKKTLLVLLGFVLLSASGCRQRGFVYTTNGRTVTITHYAGPGGMVTIPETINGRPVTRISDRAFFARDKLISVTIPNSVTSIGGFAFISCTNLSRVTIGNGVTKIEDMAFFGCNKLANVTIGKSVASIGNGAFDGCTKLDRLTIPDSVTNIGDTAFNFCGLTNVTIGNHVTSIGQGAFADCNLTNVTIPDSVISIGDMAFSGCVKLIRVMIGKNVTRIGKEAFACGCYAMTGVYFKGNAPSVGSDVFQFADDVIVYYLPGTTGWGPTFGGRPTRVWQEDK